MIASRYLKQNDYTSASSILSSGSLLLLNAEQGGSGADLAMMLLADVYQKGEWECNKENKDRLLEIFRAFPAGEPTRKRFVQDMIAWSAKFGELERGDPELHAEVGKIYAEGRYFPGVQCTRVFKNQEYAVFKASAPCDRLRDKLVVENL